MDGLPATCQGMEITPMSTAAVRPLNAQSFEAEVLASKVPVLVDFTATWCGPCKALAPILHRLAEDHAGRIEVRTVDGDEQASLAARLRIKAVPTVVAFAGGAEVGRHVGVTTREKLLRLVEGHV
jgi:thioredoxin 1